MRHLHDNLSVIGAAADDFFFCWSLVSGVFLAGHVPCPKGYFMVRYFPQFFQNRWESYIEDVLPF